MKTIELENLNQTLFNNAEKIEITNVDKINPKLSFDYYTYYDKFEINKIKSTPLNKFDKSNIKLMVQYYGYYYNEKEQTINMGKIKYDIYKIKNRLYICNTKTKNIQVLEKYFKIARALRTSKTIKKYTNHLIILNRKTNKKH